MRVGAEMVLFYERGGKIMIDCNDVTVVPKMPEAEFVSRFKARMLALVGDTFDDGASVADYAERIAPTYLEAGFEGESPEDCAEEELMP